MKKFKVVCIFLFLTIGMGALASSSWFVQPARSYSTGPPAGMTGAPGEQTCSSCHSGSPGGGQFSIVAPATYVPGQTYQIQVKHVNGDPERQRWGFELTALSGTTAAGT